ncbi:MAG: chromosome segregation protein SMC [Chloroflexota bacterium]
MRLKRLELRGFKTFANPATLAFESPITAIVGPNGSGKSNIADAVRWVLGEQSARALRTKKTEDVIFAGGTGRAQHGMAEVALTLDNESGWLGVPYTEVTLMRRAYRSGDNEYFLNATRVRLRDLTDIVLKANAGPSSVVIGQGMVDLALSMRPEERRFLFEEAADVKRHSLKIKEAQDKLSATEDNMLRVADIAAELAPRVAALERQAERARRHTALTAELGELLVRWYRHGWRRAQAQLATAEAEERAAMQALAITTTELEAAGETAATLAERRAALGEAIKRTSAEVATLSQEVARAHLEVAVGRERRTAIAARREEIGTRLGELEVGRDRAIARLAAVEDDLDAARSARSLLAADLERLGLAAAEARGRRQTRAKALAAAEAEAERLTESWAQTRAAVARLAEQHAAAQREREQRRRGTAEAETRLVELTRDVATASERLNQMAATQRELAATTTERERAVEAGEVALAARELRADGMRRERHGLQARQAALERWHQDLTGYHAGVRATLQAARGPRAVLHGIVGVVAELLHVAPEFEVAMEVALGGRLQDLVVDRWADAEAAIDLLKRTRGGRATFLPLDTLREASTANPFGGPGVLGLGCDLVRFEPAHAVVARYLLGRTVIVEDLAVARRVLKGCPPGWQIVTRAGEVVRSSGAVTGGIAGQQSGSLLAQERELRDLPKRLATLEHDAAEAERAVAAQRERLRELRAAVETARRQERELAGNRQRAESDLGAARREQDRQGKAQTQAASAVRTADETCRALAQHEERTAAQLADLARAREEARGKVEEARLALTAVDADDGDAARRLVSVRDSLAAAQREESRWEREREEREREQARLDETAEALASEGAQLAAQAEHLEAVVLSGEENHAELAGQHEALTAHETDLRADLAAIEAEASGLEESRRRLYARQNEQGASHAGAMAAVQRARSELASLRERIGGELGGERDDETAQLRFPWDEEGMTMAEEDAIPLDVLRRQIDHARAQLRQLSSVNLDAVRDYEELSERHAFLTAQHADLLQAARSLRQAIADLELTLARQFHKTFSLVATEFRHAFTTLFGGGTARLTLTQPENLLESGIDIMAQPPGKRWQSLTLLSGGERALTAVALLFAILRVKPAPFCVLDEIDAALDDTNVLRCADMIAGLAAHTQFVVITHNKSTMQAAGALYGVTIGQDASSRVVSLRLADLPVQEEATEPSAV